jgi:hypothetical protein
MPNLITLNDVVLNNSLHWKDRHTQPLVAQAVKRLLGGAAVVRSTRLTGGMPITLEATEEYGWLSVATVKQLEAMAALPGEVYSLNINYSVYSVIFRHHDEPALDLRPLLPRIPEADTEFYIGTIKLLTV